MLFMINDAGGTRPVLRCGVCDKPIANAGLAVVLYPRGIEIGQWVRILLAHKSHCLDEAESQLENDAGLPYRMELTEYLGRFLAGAPSTEHVDAD